MIHNNPTIIIFFIFLIVSHTYGPFLSEMFSPPLPCWSTLFLVVSFSFFLSFFFLSKQLLSDVFLFFPFSLSGSPHFMILVLHYNNNNSSSSMATNLLPRKISIIRVCLRVVCVRVCDVHFLLRILNSRVFLVCLCCFFFLFFSFSFPLILVFSVFCYFALPLFFIAFFF